jgi:hypothetical protein
MATSAMPARGMQLGERGLRMPQRRILSWMPDAASPYHRIYELECGHYARRRTKGDKTYCLCGECPRG